MLRKVRTRAASPACEGGHTPLGLGLNRWLAAGGTHERVHVPHVRDELKLLPGVFQKMALVVNLLTACPCDVLLQRTNTLAKARPLCELLGLEPLMVPAGLQQVLAGEEAAHLLRLDAVSLWCLAVGHDVQHCLERRAHVLDSAIADIGPRCLGLSLT